jgi:predicted metal-dependent peptidase
MLTFSCDEGDAELEIKRAAGVQARHGMTLTPVEKMIRARADLVVGHPFFAALALKLRLREDKACPTMWTDGLDLGFNPEYVHTMPLDKVTGMQAHEIMHLVCQHHTRRNGRDPGLWNKACDYAINAILLDAGFSLPQGYLDDPEYWGKSVDDIYSVLSRLLEEEKGGGTGQSEQDGVEEAESGEGSSYDGASPIEDESDATTASADDDEPEDGEENSRAAADDGEGKGGNSSEQDPGRTGEVRDHPGLAGQADKRSLERAERDMRVSLAQAVQQALNMGDLPQGLERLARTTLRPKLDWQVVLRRFLQSCTANDYSWTPPNRRYVYMDLHLPSLRSQELPDVVLAIDSSGSVENRILEQFCTEISGLLEAFDTRLTVIQCDAAVQEVQTYTRWDLPVRITPRGGGGTDYRPVFEHIETLGVRPACCIYMTDFECNRFPKAAPSYPVLWVCTAIRNASPPFGEVLRID